jgi:hypothetical protein
MFTAAMLAEARMVEDHKPETDYSIMSHCFGLEVGIHINSVKLVFIIQQLKHAAGVNTIFVLMFIIITLM